MMKDVSDVRKTIQTLIKENRGGTLRQITIAISAFLEDAVRVAGAVAVIKEEMTCGICLEVVLQTCITQCKHVFCKFCIEMSLLHRRECPLCRRGLTEASHLTLRPKADRIVEAVLLKVDPDYDSWSQKEITKRACAYDDRTKEQWHDSDNEDMDDRSGSWDEYEDVSYDFETDEEEMDDNDEEEPMERDEDDEEPEMTETDMEYLSELFSSSSSDSDSDDDVFMRIVSVLGGLGRRSGFEF